MEEKNTFNYSYSAEEQAEIEKIKSKYMPKTEDKMEKLRRLDESVTSMATTWSLVLGVTGTIVMGAGMSLTMTDLYKALSMSPTAAMVVGIILGLIGMGVAAVAYPVYNLVLERMRKKIAPEILRLADELEK
jgi:hypothetical protein